MSCGGLQCFRESLGVRKVRGTPMEIDHALILCRLVGLSHRSVQYLCFERRKLVSLAQPDDYREIWKTRHWRTLHSLWHMAPGLLDNSQRVRSSTRNSSFQQVRMAFCCTLASGPARLINAGLRSAKSCREAIAARQPLFDHLVGKREQIVGDFDAQRLCGLDVGSS